MIKLIAHLLHKEVPLLPEYNCCGSQCGHDLCVQKVPIFSALDYEDLHKISALVTHCEYHRGEMIIRQGEKPDSLIIMNTGSAKAFKYTVDGREQILYVFSEGDFFGEQYLIGDKAADYHIEALEDVKLCMLTKTDFRKLLTRYPDIAIRIIETLDNRLAHMEQSLQSMGVRSVDARIALLILSYADMYGTPGAEGTLIRLPLSREGIANYLGIARETISRKFSQMEHDHLIRSVNNKTILLLDRTALEDLSGISM